MTGTSPRNPAIRPVGKSRQFSDSFGSWILHKRRKAKTGFGALFAIPGVTFLLGILAKQVFPSIKPHIGDVVLTLVFFQAAVVFVLYWLIPRLPALAKPHDPKYQSLDLDRLKERAEVFSNLWSLAWFCWAILYFGIGISLVYKGWHGSSALWFESPLKNFLNNVQTVFFVMCFRELRYSTHQTRSPLFASISAVAGIAILEALFLIPGNPIRETFGQPFSTVVGWASGFVAGAAIALLIGRLETKLIDAPAKLTGIFYFYASIQGAYPFLTSDPAMTLTLVSLAFIFKLLLFAFVAWLLQSGMLMFYLWKMVDLDNHIPQDRKNFFGMAIKAP